MASRTFQNHAVKLDVDTTLLSVRPLEAIMDCIMDSMVDASDTTVPYTSTNWGSLSKDAVSRANTMTANNRVVKYVNLPNTNTTESI